jgi:hypothetical protein
MPWPSASSTSRASGSETISDRSETAIVALVLCAAGLAMIAPLLGRYGSPGAADVAMIAAAVAGFGAFAAAGRDTLRAIRRSHREREGGER